MTGRQKQDLIPNQDLNVTAREIHALLQYMDYTFEHNDISEFFKGFSKEDDEIWDEKATKSIYNKLLKKSNSFYKEGLLSVWDDL
tara:strand:- start:248 stop:502 length:255 start_codon:yes stop_codon:yes gene_type:complete